MEILHIATQLGVRSGGTASSISSTIDGLRRNGVNASIVFFDIFSEKDKNAIKDDHVHLISPPRERRFAYSKKFKTFLEKNNTIDLFHLQGIWQYPSYIGAKIARKDHIPYLITTHGMLYPQAVKKRMVKKIALNLFLLKDMERAACIHVTCAEEMQHLRELGVRSPIAVIPYPVEITNGIENHREIKRVGYLGRIDRRKNIERIIYAWDKLGKETKNCELVIMGKGDDKYEKFLKNESDRLGLKNVIFTGFLSGLKKQEAIKSLSCLVVSSDFENFGMVIAEALVNKVPVVAPKGSPWQELDAHKCGWWIDNDVNTISQTIKKILTLSRDEIEIMGLNGHNLVKDNYSAELGSKKMIQLYQWILKNGDQPDFIHLV